MQQHGILERNHALFLAGGSARRMAVQPSFLTSVRLADSKAAIRSKPGGGLPYLLQSKFVCPDLVLIADSRGGVAGRPSWRRYYFPPPRHFFIAVIEAAARDRQHRPAALG